MLIWPSNENYGTNCDSLDMLIKEISEIAEVGLDNVDPMGITEVLESHPTHCPMRNFMTWPNNWLNSRRKMKMRRIMEPKQCRRRTYWYSFRYRYGSWKVMWYWPWMGMQLYSKKGHKSHATPLLWNPARKEEKIKTVDVTFFLDFFWTMALAFFSKIKSDVIHIFFNYLCKFLYT